MFFDTAEKILVMKPEEMLRVAWQRYASSCEDELISLAVLPARREKISHQFSLPDGLCVRLEGEVEKEGGGLIFRFSVPGDPEHLPPRLMQQIRGLGFLYAYMVGEGGVLPLTFSLESSLNESVWQKTETPDGATLAQFWQRALQALSDDAAHVVDKAVRRMPSLASLRFPYPKIRQGQRDMIQAVYAAIKHHSTLFAMAPTGTGKTLATLFPALRALGRGYTEKVFYLTSKANLSGVAVAASEQLAASGGKMLGVVISAKERICPNRQNGLLCRECNCQKGRKKQEKQALEELYALQMPVVEEGLIVTTASKYGICPYELSLAYAGMADVVIGDYNYLFAPRVYLRRFFDVGGHYTFLIDEAHNLPDRAREMYSGELQGAFLKSLTDLVRVGAPSLLPDLEALKKAYTDTLRDMLKDCLRRNEAGESVGFASQSNLPGSLYSCLNALAVKAQREVWHMPKQDAPLREALYQLIGIAENMSRYDRHFVFYAVKEGAFSSLCFFCVDPSGLLGERLDKGDSAVFFSATLTPLDYYRAVLGGDRPASVLEVPSPFDPSSLCVGVMDKVSVRAAAREQTAAEVARIIATVLKGKKGNYMVFCPSFSYMERIAKAFTTLVPRIQTAVQKRHMSAKERQAFIDLFVPRDNSYFVAFCVTGGVYAEGIDLVGERLIGAIIVGVGLPQVSAEREMIAAYYQDSCEMGKEYAYLYPGMNRILQAAGRVIRHEEDKGVVVLIDDRFRDPACRRVFPPGWHGLKYAGDKASLLALLRHFWSEGEPPPQGQ